LKKNVKFLALYVGLMVVLAAAITTAPAEGGSIISVGSANLIQSAGVGFRSVHGLSSDLDLTAPGGAFASSPYTSTGAEFCLDRNCGGATGPRTDPSALYLTNSSVTCTSTVGSCGLFIYSISAHQMLGVYGVTEVVTVFLDFILSSTSGTPSVSGSLSIGGSSLPFSATGSGTYEYQMKASLTPSLSYLDFASLLRLDSLSANSTFSLPGSAKFVLADLPIPEPSSVGLIAAGLAGLAWLRRKSLQA